MIKLLLLGDTNVGKTSMLHFFYKKRPLQDPLATIGIDFIPVKDAEGKTFAHIWDTGGLEKYQCITRHYFSGAHCVMLVYDVKNKLKSPYDQVMTWYNDVVNMCGECAVDKIPVMIVGNKSDELNKQTEICESLKPLLAKHKSTMKHMFTSARTGKNIKAAFSNLLCDSQKACNSPILNRSTKVYVEPKSSQVIHCCY